MHFRRINRAYGEVFRVGQLTVGLVVPLEHYPAGPVPSLESHLQRVQLAEELGFAAVWLRDVPFNVPSFGDAGQLFDPFVYLGYLAAHTSRIALGVASVILPLRHPAHVAKAAASADVLSGGRVLLGIASGDRPDEYPALAMSYGGRGARFRTSYDYIRAAFQPHPEFENAQGKIGGGMDLLPKPTGGDVALLVTGGSQQDPEWLASHGDGWMVYPQAPAQQARLIQTWRARTAELGGPSKPVMQPLYLDLVDDAAASPQPIHLGNRMHVRHVAPYLESLAEAGVNHVAINLRFHRSGTESAMEELARELLPRFGR